MFPVSDRFLAAVGDSFDYVVEADVYRSGEKANDQPLRLVDGEATITDGQAIRRTSDLVFADDTGGLVPIGITDPLMPNGAEVQVRAGPRFADGTTELADVGRFRLSSSKSVFGRVECAGYDLGLTLGTPLTQAFPYAAGLAIEDVIAAIAQRKNPAVTFDPFVTNETTVAGVMDLHDIPMTVIRRLAYSAGCDAFFDQSARLAMALLRTTPGVTSVVDFVEGDARVLGSTQAKFWDETADVESDNVPSVVVVEANHSSLNGATLRTVVRDTNPASPTYADGPYGEVVTTVQSDTISTQAQSTSLGVSELGRNAWANTYEWSCSPNPALAETDTVSLTCERLRLVHKLVLVTGITLPYYPEAMTITATERRALEYSTLEG